MSSDSESPYSGNEDPFAFFGADIDDATDPPGLKCELSTYDARYNAKGQQIRLQAGRKRNLGAKRPRDHDAALVLTRYFDTDKILEYTQLEVRSPHLKTALKSVIPKYPGVNIHAKKVIIRDLPKCLFHYRLELQQYGNRLKDPEAVQHLVFGLTYMYDTLQEEISTYFNLMESPGIEPGLPFLSLWMAYRPGDLIYSKSNGVDRVYQLHSMTRCECLVPFCRKSRWELALHEIEYNGADFGYHNTLVYIDPYEGHIPLKDLKAFPLRHHPNQRTISELLFARGKRFVELLGVHFLSYDGVAEALSGSRNKTFLGEDDEFPLQSLQVKSRIMIDAKTFYAARPSHKPAFVPQGKAIRTEDNDHLKLTDAEFMICNHEMPGFSLTDKRWCFFNIDNIREVDFNLRAFQSLLLPQDQKEMIHSLVKIHSDERLSFDDVIKGKGRGMIFLLHGMPGVGKTLTAESVADVTRRPLYTISSGELGVGAGEVEGSLNIALRLATTWDAIILIDEADVFLKQRSAHDLERNSLVSIFLRALEYYEGIMFLTTNRIGTFDAAFKSRIHLAIKYPSLSTASRCDLWRSFITSTSPNSHLSWLTSNCLESLAAEELNGRQIKNIVRTAQALAVSSNNQLMLRHIRTALDAMKMFEADFAEDAENASNEAQLKILESVHRSNKRVRVV